MTTFVKTDRVHQILINDSGRLPTSMPHQLVINMDSVHEHYKSASYTLWSGESLESFIASNFDRDVFDAYLILKPFSYRSDLARFCLLFTLGGLYVDLGIRVFRRWDIPSTKGIGAFRDISFISDSWSALQTGLLWSTPGRPELQFAIENIVENVRNRYYGNNPLYPTGPVTLGRAFVRAMVSKGQTEDADDQYVGQCRALTSDADVINLCYVTKQGVFIAMRTKDRDGDLTHLGLTGVNNYNMIWRSRGVYGETTRRWAFKDPLVKRHRSVQKTGQALVIKPETTDIAVFGPYVDLPAGVFEVELLLAGDGKTANVCIEITSDCGGSLLRMGECEVNENGFSWFKCDFTLWRQTSAVEIRILNRSLSTIALREYTITERATTLWPFNSPDIHYRSMDHGLTSAPIEGDIPDALVYGPYVNLSAGDYFVHALFASQTRLNNPYIEILSDTAETIIGISQWDCYHERKDNGLKAKFKLESDAREVEFRLGWSSGSAGGFLGYALYKLR